MIFVTVGTQLPFDRLISAVDAWAGERPGNRVFAQIGPSELRPRHIEYRDFIAPSECRDQMARASVIVAHAGMGTILSALELGKPVLVMPRVAALGEHRNEHQLATARRFADLGKARVVFDEHELPRALDELEGLAAQERISPYASDRLIGTLRAFIEGLTGQGPEGTVGGQRQRGAAIAAIGVLDPGDRFGPRAGVELPERGRQVGLDRALGEVELVRDLLVRSCPAPRGS